MADVGLVADEEQADAARRLIAQVSRALAVSDAAPENAPAAFALLACERRFPALVGLADVGVEWALERILVFAVIEVVDLFQPGVRLQGHRRAVFESSHDHGPG